MAGNKPTSAYQQENQEDTPPEVTPASLKQKRKLQMVTVFLVILLAASLVAIGYFSYRNDQPSQKDSRDEPPQELTAPVEQTSIPDPSTSNPRNNYLFLATGVLYSHGTGFCVDMVEDLPRASLIIDLPQNFKVSEEMPDPLGNCDSPPVHNEALIEKGGTAYKVTASPSVGLSTEEGECPPYEDRELKDGAILRLWKKYKQETEKCENVYLNFQSISVDGYFLDNFIVTKEEPDDIFSPDEVSLWKNLFNQIKAITS